MRSPCTPCEAAAREALQQQNCLQSVWLAIAGLKNGHFSGSRAMLQPAHVVGCSSLHTQHLDALLLHLAPHASACLAPHVSLPSALAGEESSGTGVCGWGAG